MGNSNNGNHLITEAEIHIPKEETPAESKVIIRSENPYGTMLATLEDDGRTVYLYMNPVRDATITPKALWIRNLLEAPAETDKESLRIGRAPLLRKDACRHPQGKRTVKPEEARIVWFQEGTGVALFIRDELEAILPPWSGEDGIYGYAKEASAKDMGTLPFPADFSGLLKRVKENEAHWESRSRSETWAAFRDRLLAHYEKAYGPHSRYFAVSGHPFPPLAVVEFATDPKNVYYATLGMSYQNLPGAELVLPDAQNHVRIEVITRYDRIREDVPNALGTLASFPWANMRFIHHGHTFITGVQDDHLDYLLTGMYSEDEFKAPEDITVDDQYPVNFLYAIPITKAEVDTAAREGSRKLLEKKIRFD